MFAMFGAFSESEMHIKKQRLMRGKRARAEKGYYIGGPILFGYKVDENKKLVHDEQKANTVRKMFYMYSKGLSLSAIATELCSTGEMDKLHWKLVYTHIHKLLQRPEYFGGHGVTLNTNYPPIISEELFNKVQILLHSHSHPHSKIKYIYYAHKLLRCKIDGHCLTTTMSNCCYRYGGDVYIKDEQKHLRVVSWNINMNLVDSILWHFTKKYRRTHSAADIKKMRKELEDEMLVLKRKIGKSKRDIEDYNGRIRKTNERIINGKMSESHGDELIRDFEYEIMTLKDNIEHWETAILNATCQYQILDMGIYQKSVDNVTNDNERYDIIHQCIKVVWVDKVKYARYKFEIVFIDDTSVSFENIPNNFNRVLLNDGKWESFERLVRFSR